MPQMVMVEGESMEPLLPSGAWVLVRRRPRGLPRLGQVVVVEHPHRSGFELVKRVGAVSRERRLIWVLGDNRTASTDSDQFGPLPAEALRGLVVARIRPGPLLWLGTNPSQLG
jgi:nickel-type superoxide dismutase maturation protease